MSHQRLAIFRRWLMLGAAYSPRAYPWLLKPVHVVFKPIPE